MNEVTLKLWEYLLSQGLLGVLTFCLAFVAHRQWQQIALLQEQRVKDAETTRDKMIELSSKVERTVDRFCDVSDKLLQGPPKS